ncbi:MAG: DUF2061 domain-containing protein [archaeon]
MEDSFKRSLVKSITYRVLASLALAGISWFYTGNLFETSFITIAFTLVATVLYYAHERIWNKIEWQRHLK